MGDSHRADDRQFSAKHAERREAHLKSIEGRNPTIDSKVCYIQILTEDTDIMENDEQKALVIIEALLMYC